MLYCLIGTSSHSNSNISWNALYFYRRQLMPRLILEPRQIHIILPIYPHIPIPLVIVRLQRENPFPFFLANPSPSLSYRALPSFNLCCICSLTMTYMFKLMQTIRSAIIYSYLLNTHFRRVIDVYRSSSIAISIHCPSGYLYCHCPTKSPSPRLPR